MRRDTLPGAIRWMPGAWSGAVVVTLSLAGLTAVLAPFQDGDHLVAVSMLLLLLVLAASAAWGWAVGLYAAVLADVLLNFFFIPPVHTFTVHEPANVAALGVFLAVAAVGASMLSLLRRQLRLTEERRAELAIMLHLSRELAAAPTPERALESLVSACCRALDAKRCDLLRRDGNAWAVVASSGAAPALTRDEASISSEVVESGVIARRSRAGPAPITRVIRHAEDPADTFVPIKQGGGAAGVLRLAGSLTAPPGGDLDALLRAFADEAGVAMHRAELAEGARAAEVLQQSDAFKTTLLSSVSHDLRSPLTAIKAAAGSLRSRGVEWSAEDREQLLETIESQTDRLAATVADLLEMSRIEGGASRPTPEPVEVRPLLLDAASGSRETTAGRDVRVEAPEGLWVRADYGFLLQSLTNLIENAAKYSQPEGAIRLHAEGEAGRVTLRVVDEGPGIAPADLPHVFDRFYRGSNGKRLPGTGLGLAIVRAMVELCGGRVSVDSSPAGSTFLISLPPARAPE